MDVVPNGDDDNGAGTVKQVPPRVPCEYCGGKGKLLVGTDEVDDWGWPVYQWARCEACGGSGIESGHPIPEDRNNGT